MESTVRYCDDDATLSRCAPSAAVCSCDEVGKTETTGLSPCARPGILEDGQPAWQPIQPANGRAALDLRCSFYVQCCAVDVLLSSLVQILSQLDPVSFSLCFPFSDGMEQQRLSQVQAKLGGCYQDRKRGRISMQYTCTLYADDQPVAFQSTTPCSLLTFLHAISFKSSVAGWL